MNQNGAKAVDLSSITSTIDDKSAAFAIGTRAMCDAAGKLEWCGSIAWCNDLPLVCNYDLTNHYIPARTCNLIGGKKTIHDS